MKIVYDEGGIGGNCPVQAEGTIDGLPFYFRSRHRTWSLTIAVQPGADPVGGVGCVSYYEEYRGEAWKEGEEHAAGWAPVHECRQFIERAAAILREPQKGAVDWSQELVAGGVQAGLAAAKVLRALLCATGQEPTTHITYVNLMAWLEKATVGKDLYQKPE